MRKYQPGDLLGNDQIKLLARTRKDNSGIWFATFECPYCKRTFEARIGDVSRGHTRSCGCLGVATKKENGKRNMKDLTGKTYGLLSVIKPTEKRAGGNVVWECLCSCGNKCFVNSGGWERIYSCGCIKSKGEAIIQKILSDNNISFEKQKTFSDLVYNNSSLRFDFYLPDNNCLIEFDGIQHFQYSNSGWDTQEKFIDTVKRDSFKNEWSKYHNIPLIRISYKDINNITYSYLIKLIKEATLCF